MGPERIPRRDLKGKAFQLFLSEFTYNTFLSGAFSDNRDVFVTDILEYYMDTKGKPLLTTDIVGRVFPQIPWRYGTGKKVVLRVKMLGPADNVPQIRFIKAIGYEQTAKNFEMALLVQKDQGQYEECLVMHIDSYSVTGNIYDSPEDFKIKGQIQEPEVNNLTVTRTTLKDVTSDVLINEF
jgi:hypothetical protein